MAESTDRSVMLLSIHPEYADRILDGTKTVELRKTAIDPQVSAVVIYCTAPVQKVVGYFDVGRIVRATPATIWRRFRNSSGISRDAFESYYSGCEIGSAIIISQANRLQLPIELTTIDATLVPPQGIRYLPRAIADRVFKRAHAA